jgi:trk system potassium uptake protein TrkA
LWSIGSFLAQLILRFTQNVTVIDKDPASFSRLPENFSGRTVIGDAFQEEVWLDVHIKKAELLITATADEEDNAMLAIMAKKRYGIPEVIALVPEPNYKELFHNIGIDSYTKP